MGAVTRQSAYPPTGEASGTNTMKKRRKQLNISTPLIYSPTATSPKEGDTREALKERLASIGQDGAYNANQYLKKIYQTQEEIVYSDSWLTKVKTDFQSGNPHSVSQHDCLQANPDSTKSERFSGSHQAPHAGRDHLDERGARSLTVNTGLHFHMEKDQEKRFKHPFCTYSPPSTQNPTPPTIQPMCRRVDAFSERTLQGLYYEEQRGTRLKNNKGMFNEEQQPALDQRNQSQATMPSE
ncbi:hypothetical protein KUCAC02_007306 [Chaenocephalus aceratus]|uniref:Uncharacterized protein n=1 Tax=Chaenocephalus aceratus TaxID=36190 RepID=A0ACB9X6W6_CHAAC|nr:hypothetical protein KUCAC02_007306 [Chaenocephalus aceratus]